MVAEGQDKPKVESEEPESPIVAIPADQVGNPKWYVNEIAMTLAKEKAGKIKSLTAKQRLEFLKNAYHTVTDENLSDAATKVLSPIDRLSRMELIEHTGQQLDELEEAIAAIDADRITGLSPKKKATWLDYIKRTRALQAKAKSNAIYNWIYIGRTSEDNKVFHMGEIHKRFFEVWANTEYQHSLIMAPPSHGKTVSLTGQMLWDIKENPRVRILLWFDAEDKASKQLQLVKRYIGCKRFKALYPHLGIMRDEENSAKRFTITRDNIGSREPSMEAAGTISLINGDGYDIIYVDDPCPETVAQQQGTRQAINYKFDSVVSQRFRSKEISRFRIVCTPWHPEDLAGHIMSGVRCGERTGWLVAVDQFTVKKDDEGRHVSLWPERYDSAYYAERESALHYDDYARLFELKFAAESTKIVQRVKFYPYNPDDSMLSAFPDKWQKYYESLIAAISNAEQWLSVDPSATSGRHSAECCATQIALTTKGRAFVRECWFMPGNPVAMQEWIVDRIVNHGIHRVLIEDQGAQAGQVALWIDYIKRRLRELQVHWNGSIVTCKTQRRGGGGGGGQNIGKRMRLKQCAALIQNGYIRFPGQVKRNYQAGGKLYFDCVDNANIRKLKRQIIDFPIGTCDGVDTITQFVRENISRLETNAMEPSIVVESNEIYDSLRVGKDRAIKEQSTPPVDRDSEREHQWLTGCLG